MKLYSYLFLILSFMACKKLELKTTDLLPQEGLWHLGSETGCIVTKNFQGIFKVHALALIGSYPYYNYRRAQIFYTDHLCKKPFLKIESTGLFTSQGKIAVTGNVLAERIIMSETNYIGTFLTQEGVDQANLQTLQGLQQVSGQRFCSLSQDWQIQVGIDLSNKLCGLEVITEVHTQTFNLMQVADKQLKFGVANTANFPMLIIDLPEDTWYKD